jgi:hypothetical protein
MTTSLLPFRSRDDISEVTWEGTGIFTSTNKSYTSISEEQQPCCNSNISKAAATARRDNI